MGSPEVATYSDGLVHPFTNAGRLQQKIAPDRAEECGLMLPHPARDNEAEFG